MSKCNVMRFLGILFCAGIICLPALTEGAKKAEGVGIASGSGAAAHQEALSRALRNAVERAVGVMVSSESLVKNFQLLEDHIYSNVQGYVTEYEIIEDNKGAENLTRIKILAVVEETQLESDLAGINLIIEAKGNPRTVIMITETMNGEAMESSSVAVMIENTLGAKNFPLVDASQLEELKERDANLDTDPEKAKVLGNRIGAEIIINGSARTEEASVVEAYGVPVYAYSGTLTLKCINAVDGSIITSLQATEIGRAGTPGEASANALQKAWEEKSQTFLAKILEKWRSEVLNTTTMTLMLSKVPADKRQNLLTRLAKVAGVVDLDERGYQEGIMELVLKVDGAVAGSLDEKMVESLPDLLLTSKASHRLDFEFQG